MKFMEGGSLAKRLGDFRLPLCDAKTRKDDHGKTWTRSEIDKQSSKIVSLITTVARAMHHAHQRGLLHRDLKPGNILLDALDQPHITDFGLAKRATLGPDVHTHCEWLTGNEAIVGTAPYMPPEQARAEKLLSTAVDVYGLGAILYELLTGRPPFRADSVIETLIQVREQDPEPPRKLNPIVNRDLETICLKCLEKDPANRYGSAEALAEELDRHHRGEPILARPVGRVERAWRWCERKPVVAGLGAVLTCVILESVVGLTLLWLHAEDSRDQAERNEGLARQSEAEAKLHATRAEKQQERAESSFRLARQTMTDITRKLRQDERVKSGPFEDLRRLVLDVEKGFYESFVELKGDEPSFRAERGRAHDDLGLVTAEVAPSGAKHAALPSYRQAVDIFGGLMEEYPERSEYREYFAKSYVNLANALSDTGAEAEAELTYRLAPAVQQGLARQQPGALTNQVVLATVYANLTTVCHKLGRAVEAGEYCQKALSIRSRLATTEPTVSKYRADLAVSYNHLAILHFVSGSPKEAQTADKQALELMNRLVEEFPSAREYERQLAESHHTLAILYYKMGRVLDGVEAGKRAVAMRRRLADRHPSVADYGYDLAHSYQNLAVYLKEADLSIEAEDACQSAVTLLSKLSNDHPQVPDYRSSLSVAPRGLANLYAGLGRVEDAEKAYHEALKIQIAIVRDTPSVPDYQDSLAELHANLGLILEALGRRREAEQRFQDAIVILEPLARDYPTTSEYSATLGGTYGMLGRLRLNRGQLQPALVSFGNAVLVLNPLIVREPRDPDLRVSLRQGHWGSALCLTQLGQHSEALAHWDHAIEFEAGAHRDTLWLLRAMTRARLKDHAKAAFETETQPKDRDVRAGILCNAACVYALSANACQSDMNLASDYQARGVQMLRRAVAKGYGDLEFLKKDAALAPLRSRPDFKQLVAELEEKLKSKEPPARRLREALERHYAWPLLWGWPRF
jgi:tetratricopeptide (TPR) repeat protein